MDDMDTLEGNEKMRHKLSYVEYYVCTTTMMGMKAL